MKRWYVSAFLLAVLVLLPGTALAADGDYTCIEGDDHFLTITGWSGVVDSDGTLEIPQKINDIEVKRIASRAFSGKTEIKHLILPEGLQYMGSAFQDCTSLESVYIPSTLEGANGLPALSLVPNRSGSAPFSGCANLKSINVAASEEDTIEGFGISLPKVPATLFQGCTGLVEVTIPSHATVIETNAFRGCVNLTTVNFPQEDPYLTTIAAGAFYGCTSLLSAQLPEGLQALNGDSANGGAFAGCTSLSHVHIPASLRSASAPFAQCSSLNGVPSEDAEGVTFGTGITSIVSTLFQNATGLREIEIPETVTSIGANAFAGSGLTEIVIPDNVTSYGTGAFQVCRSLTSAVLSARASTIPERMFYLSNVLKTVSSKGRYEIAREAFRECYDLQEITLEGGVTTIGESAFRECKRLTEIPLGTVLTSIGKNAFYRCEALPAIDLPEGLLSIGTNAFQYALLLDHVQLPSTLTTIPAYAFANCPALTAIDIPKSVKTIGDYAFYQDTALLLIFIPASVTSISDKEAFSYFDKMTVEGVPGSYAQAWAEANGAKFEDASVPITSIRLASGKDSLIVPRRQNFAPVFVTEPENNTDALTITSPSSSVAVRNGYILYCSSRVTEPVTITVTATSGYTYEFTVTSQDMTNIRPAVLPEIVNYTVGDKMDWTGFIPEAVFQNGETEQLYNYPVNADTIRDKVVSWTASDPDLSSTGDKSATVSYGSASASFDVHVYGSASEIPVSIRRVETTDDGVRVLLHGASGTVSLFAAAYTEDGKFLGMASKALSASEISAGSASLTLDTSSAATVKAFLTADTSTALRPVQTVRTLDLAFVRNADDVDPVDPVDPKDTDVTFFSGKSASKRIDESDYSAPYREYTVVRNGVVETILVSANATLTSPATSKGSELDVSGNEYDVNKAWRGVIVNEMNWDSDNELVTSGNFNNREYDAGFAWGIKTTGNTYEIRVGTNENGFDGDGEPNINGANYTIGNGRLWDLASDVHVYYADGDEITPITVNDIVTDEDDFVYWTEYDGKITDLFICEYEP